MTVSRYLVSFALLASLSSAYLVSRRPFLWRHQLQHQRSYSSASTCLRAEEGGDVPNEEVEVAEGDGEHGGELTAGSKTDILSSPAFLKRKLEVLKNDLAAAEQDLEEAKQRLEEGKKEWGQQLDALQEEVCFMSSHTGFCLFAKSCLLTSDFPCCLYSSTVPKYPGPNEHSKQRRRRHGNRAGCPCNAHLLGQL